MYVVPIASEGAVMLGARLIPTHMGETRGRRVLTRLAEMGVAYLE